MTKGNKISKIKPTTEQYKKLQREAAARQTTVHALLTNSVYAAELKTWLGK